MLDLHIEARKLKMIHLYIHIENNAPSVHSPGRVWLVFTIYLLKPLLASVLFISSYNTHSIPVILLISINEETASLSLHYFGQSWVSFPVSKLCDVDKTVSSFVFWGLGRLDDFWHIRPWSPYVIELKLPHMNVFTNWRMPTVTNINIYQSILKTQTHPANHQRPHGYDANTDNQVL